MRQPVIVIKEIDGELKFKISIDRHQNLDILTKI